MSKILFPIFYNSETAEEPKPDNENGCGVSPAENENVQLGLDSCGD